MAQNYTDWPTAAQIIEQLNVAGIPIRDNTLPTFYAGIVDGVVSELERRTQRQFIADTVDSERAFDGSGSGEQMVDDMVSLTTVSVSGWIGIEAFNITDAVLLDQKIFPRNKIIMAQGPPYQYVHGVFTRFPEGRANIFVTGKWGFGTYIPDSVWLAVRSRVSTKMASMFLADSNTGRIIKSWMEGSSAEKYADGDFKQIGEIQGWIEEWKCCINDFRKPLNDRMKKKVRPMI